MYKKHDDFLQHLAANILTEIWKNRQSTLSDLD